MSAQLDRAVGLLEASLTGTREVLGRVGARDLRRATPCAGWDLAALVRHMDESLAAYLEASHGHLRLAPLPASAAAPGGAPVASVRARACTLLGAWSLAAEQDLDGVALDGATLVGATLEGAGLPADLLVCTAALEVAVHGWDVARSLDDPGCPTVLTEALATALLPVARCTVAAGRGSGHFAPAVATPPRAGAPAVLLGLLGRTPSPPAPSPRSA